LPKVMDACSQALRVGDGHEGPLGRDSDNEWERWTALRRVAPAGQWPRDMVEAPSRERRPRSGTCRRRTATQRAEQGMHGGGLRGTRGNGEILGQHKPGGSGARRQAAARWPGTRCGEGARVTVWIPRHANGDTLAHEWGHTFSLRHNGLPSLMKVTTPLLPTLIGNEAAQARACVRAHY